MPDLRKTILALTGASGQVYARRLLDVLERAGCELHLLATDNARRVACRELDLPELTTKSLLHRPCPRVHWHNNDDLFSPLASGSNPTDAMAVCPCTSHTLAALAAGLADTLLLRTAYVTLKQRRPLVLVHREMPLTAIDIDNMAALSRAGAIICPASPAFYHGPTTLDDLVDSVVARVAQLLGVDHDLPVNWQP